MFKKITNLSLATVLMTLNLGANTNVLAEEINGNLFNNEKPLLSQANNSNGGNRRRNNFGPERLLEKLNLSTEQKEKMQNIRQNYKTQMKTIRENLSSERKTLREMMNSNESINALRSQHKKIVALDGQLHNLRFENMLEMREVLTMEQRKQFAEMMEEKRENRRGGNRRGSSKGQ